MRHCYVRYIFSNNILGSARLGNKVSICEATLQFSCHSWHSGSSRTLLSPQSPHSSRFLAEAARDWLALLPPDLDTPVGGTAEGGGGV